MGKALIAVKIIDKVLPEKAFLNIFTLGGLLGSNHRRGRSRPTAPPESNGPRQKPRPSVGSGKPEKAAADEAERVAKAKALREHEAFLRAPERKKESWRG